jgi:elongation factor P--(R)-beta-lysine ligase
LHANRQPRLRARNAIKARLRGWFAGRDFTEVETAALQVSPGNETHLHAFEIELMAPDGFRQPLYLHTSPEFACKKLLAAGEQRIFTFAHAYRNRERGALHHPEFTLLEWYRAGEPFEAVIADCLALLREAADAAQAPVLQFRDRTCDPFAEPEMLTVAAAFERHAGVDLLASVEAETTDREGLAAQAVAGGIRVAADDAWADIFSKVLVERIEARLGHGRPTVLYEYPAALGALARRKPADPRVAERFELYACGVELANGFGELTDAAEQRRRFEAEMAEKARIYGERYPIDEDFLAALAVMPEASGVALGFDRLVMLATGAAHIEQVIWTPVSQPSG